MSRTRAYEFDVETLDLDDVRAGSADPEILDHWHAYDLSSYPERILRACAETGGNFRLCVVRDDLRGADGIVSRSWAYLLPACAGTGHKPVMETEFKDAGGAVIAQVPAHIMDQIRLRFRLF